MRTAHMNRITVVYDLDPSNITNTDVIDAINNASIALVFDSTHADKLQKLIAKINPLSELNGTNVLDMSTLPSPLQEAQEIKATLETTNTDVLSALKMLSALLKSETSNDQDEKTEALYATFYTLLNAKLTYQTHNDNREHSFKMFGPHVMAQGKQVRAVRIDVISELIKTLETQDSKSASPSNN